MHIPGHALAFLLASAPLQGSAPSEEPLRIYLDADQTHTRQAGLSIELGLRAALDDLGGTLGGRPVELLVRDHRGNSRRSRQHLEEFAEDPLGVAVFCGLHSPPVLAARDLIHGRGLPVLDPWAAAGPITRGEHDPHWIFRLSVDDTKAGAVIARHAVEAWTSRAPALLLERTGWGRSSEESLRAALAELGTAEPSVHWFDWGLETSRAREIAHEIVERGADSVLLVANAPEGRDLLAALAEVAEPGSLGVSSHWGITGEDLEAVVPDVVRERIDVAVIQTRAVDLVRTDARAANVVRRALERHPELAFDGELGAAVGFVHAYDLVLLLDQAVRQALASSAPGASGQALRDPVRRALEDLEGEVEGLLRTYRAPFAPHAERGEDAHEALGTEDLLMVPLKNEPAAS